MVAIAIDALAILLELIIYFFFFRHFLAEKSTHQALCLLFMQG